MNLEKNNPVKILIILASGIGNSILFSPALMILKKEFPKSRIDLFTQNPLFIEPFKGSNLINKIFCYQGIGTIFALRNQNYDISITAFPSNKWQFNLFAYVIGAKYRVTHSYKFGKFSTMSFLQNKKIPADENLHDIEQNLSLLSALNIKASKKNVNFLFFISKKHKKFADIWLGKKGIKKNDFLLGIHPGAGGTGSVQLRKRMPLDNWLPIIEEEIGNKNAKIIIFGGHDEIDIKEKMQKILSKKFNNVLIFESDLKKTTALISKCNLFLSNDSGLMHIAEAVNCPKIIAAFGPTRQTRTRPYGKQHKTITFEHNCPKLEYPFYSTSGRIPEENLGGLEKCR